MKENKTYVEELKSMCYSDVRIMFIHIIPNCISSVIVQITLDTGYAILDLAGMSFLGFGVQPPTAEWGYMLSDSRTYINSAPHMISVNRAARPGQPMPQARPMAIAMNTAAISLAEPGAERKRTSEKVPATATPAPMLPLTIRMMTLTTAGSIASVTAKLRVQGLFLR